MQCSTSRECKSHLATVLLDIDQCGAFEQQLFECINLLLLIVCCGIYTVEQLFGELQSCCFGAFVAAFPVISGGHYKPHKPPEPD